MRITPAAIIVATVAGAAHVVGVALDQPALALPGGAVALVTLAAYVAVAGRHRPPVVRWPLFTGLLVLAAGTATGLVWDVAAARSRPFGFFAYEPLDAASLLPAPDLWHHRWVEALALAAYAGIALAVVRLPGRRDRTDAVVVAAAGAALLFGYGSLAVWAASDIRPATMAAAVPAVAIAAVALGAGIWAARRSDDGAVAVWVGMILLAVPALRGAADAVALSVTAALRDADQASGFLTPGDAWDTTLAQAPFAFPAFFAALRLVAVGLVAVGVTSRMALYTTDPAR